MNQFVEVAKAMKDLRRNLLPPGTNRLAFDYSEQALRDFFGKSRNRVVL